MKRNVYRSKVDWWAWLCLLGLPLAMWFTAIGMPWWYWVFICGSMTALCVPILFGCWYEIDGEDLLVYMFFRPNRIPIGKIKSVKKVNGFLATAGMSTKRISISFVDRSVLKSYAPLEISPKDRDNFIEQLQAINPKIEIL